MVSDKGAMMLRQQSPIVAKPPTLGQVPPGAMLVARVGPKALGQGAPGAAEDRAYIRQGGELFSWRIEDKEDAAIVDRTTWGKQTIENVPAGTADYDQFLVVDNALPDKGMVKFRTAGEMVSDLGVSTSSHTHEMNDLTDATTSAEATNDLLEWNGSNWVNVAKTTIDHGEFGGLLDDDHTQYVLLAGRGTGQTINGGTSSGEDLTLESTAHATKGNIIIPDGQGVVIGHTSQIDFGAIPEFQILGTATPDSSMGFAVFSSTASVGPDFRFLKSRGVTIGANTLVVDGDRLGRIRFQGADGGDFATTAAEFQVEVDGVASLNNVYGRFIWRTRTSGGLTEKMRLDSTGRLGIGTTNPLKDLHITSNVPTFRFSDGNAATDQAVATLLEFYRGDNDNRIGFWGMASTGNDIMALATDYAAGEIAFRTGSNVDAMTIDSSQNIGVGTTAPRSLFNVHAAAGSDSVISLSDGDVSHGFTSLVDNEIYLQLQAIGVVTGGALISAFSEGDQTALIIRAGIDSINPTDTTPAMQFRAGKLDSGTNSLAALAATETGFQFSAYNGGTDWLTILGDGKVGVGTVSPSEELEVEKSQDSATRILIDNVNTGTSAQSGLQLKTDGGSAYIYRTSDAYSTAQSDALIIQETGGGPIVLFTNAEAARITNDGKVGIGTAVPNQTLAFGNESTMGDVSYSSGWGGTDWALTYSSGLAVLEIDDLWVRGALHVYELIMNQISAVNGGLIISAGVGKVASVSGSASTEQIVFEDPESTSVAQFQPGDILLIQNINLDSTTLVKRIVREVNTISGMTVTCKATTGAPADAGSIAKGDTVVVIGNIAGGAASGNLIAAKNYDMLSTSDWGTVGSVTLTDGYDSGDAAHSTTLRIEAGDTTLEGAALSTFTTLTDGLIYRFDFDFKTISNTTVSHQFRIDKAVGVEYTKLFTFKPYWQHFTVNVKSSELATVNWSSITKFLVIIATTGGAASDELLIDNFSVKVMGNARDSLIYLTATDSHPPYIQFMDGVDSWDAWTNPDKIKVVIGNLEGKYGYTSELYGLAAGDFTSSHLTIDPTNGLRFRNSTATLMQLDGDSLVFKSSGSTKRIEINATDNELIFYDASGEALRIDDDILGLGKSGIYCPSGGIAIFRDTGGVDTWIKDGEISVSGVGDTPKIVAVHSSELAADTRVIQARNLVSDDGFGTADQYKRIGVFAESAVTGATSDPMAVGIWATATNAGNGTAWAGYFEDGDVHIDNKLGIGTLIPGEALEVNGNIAVEKAIFPASGVGTLTISAGVITIDANISRVDTESAASTDDLDTVNGGTDGQIIALYGRDNGRDVTLKDGAGNLSLAGDFTLAVRKHTIMLLYSAQDAVWLELARSSN